VAEVASQCIHFLSSLPLASPGYTSQSVSLSVAAWRMLQAVVQLIAPSRTSTLVEVLDTASNDGTAPKLLKLLTTAFTASISLLPDESDEDSGEACVNEAVDLYTSLCAWFGHRRVLASATPGSVDAWLSVDSVARFGRQREASGCALALLRATIARDLCEHLPPAPVPCTNGTNASKSVCVHAMASVLPQLANLRTGKRLKGPDASRAIHLAAAATQYCGGDEEAEKQLLRGLGVLAARKEFGVAVSKEGLQLRDVESLLESLVKATIHHVSRSNSMSDLEQGFEDGTELTTKYAL